MTPQPRLRQIFEEAGFTRLRRVIEAPVGLTIEARP